MIGVLLIGVGYIVSYLVVKYHVNRIKRISKIDTESYLRIKDALMSRDYMSNLYSPRTYKIDDNYCTEVGIVEYDSGLYLVAKFDDGMLSYYPCSWIYYTMSVVYLCMCIPILTIYGTVLLI